MIQAQRVIVCVTVLALTSCGGGDGSRATEPGTEPSTASTAEVTATDFEFEPGIVQVASGSELTLVNRGYAFHNIKVEGENGLLVPDVDSGGENSVTIDLPSGEYVFFCSIGNHRSQGMEGTLEMR